jgi:hypothetical protein
MALNHDPVREMNTFLGECPDLRCLDSTRCLMKSSLTVSAAHTAEPSVSGLWQKTEGDRAVGWFLFVERNGAYEGAIAKLFRRPEDGLNPPICSSKCTDDRRNAPLLGLSLITARYTAR